MSNTTPTGYPIKNAANVISKLHLKVPLKAWKYLENMSQFRHLPMILLSDPAMRRHSRNFSKTSTSWKALLCQRKRGGVSFRKCESCSCWIFFFLGVIKNLSLPLRITTMFVCGLTSPLTSSYYFAFNRIYLYIIYIHIKYIIINIYLLFGLFCCC